MGLGDFFKRLTKGPPKDGETPQVPENAPPGRRRRYPVPMLPNWSKKGNAFVRDDMGMMKPPEDMAEEASFKRPDSWLQKRIAAAKEAEGLDKASQNAKTAAGLKKSLSDEDIENFLSNVLGENAPKEEPEGEEPKGT